MNERLVTEALFKTDEKLYMEVDGGGSFYAAIVKRGARVAKYRKYERGDHDANLTIQQRRLLNIVKDASELNEASANYCSIVVDMMAGRVSISDVNAEDDVVNDWIIDTISRNGFASKQGEWFRGAIRDSESFVIVDPQTALWSSEPAFDGNSGIVAVYDNMTGLPKWACKLWTSLEPSDVSTDFEDKGDENVCYIVVYQPNQITYWKGEVGAGDLQPVPVTPGGLRVLQSGNGYEWDLGIVPVIQFANKKDNYTSYGESEIRCVIPLQDIVNSTLYDMMMASKLSAFKIYWSKGMEIDKDGIVPGSVINLVLKDSAGNVLTNIDESASRFLSAVQVGEFGVTDMSQYTNQLDKLEREISQVSATPVYGVTTQNAVSGEALKQLEIGLINKIVRFQNENTDSIRLLFKLTALIQRRFDVRSSFARKLDANVINYLGLSAPINPPNDVSDINLNWKSPEIVNTSAQITALSTMRRDNPNLWADEWYRERIGSLLGMSSQQIAEESEKADTERVNAFDQLVGGRSGTAPVV